MGLAGCLRFTCEHITKRRQCSGKHAAFLFTFRNSIHAANPNPQIATRYAVIK